MQISALDPDHAPRRGEVFLVDNQSRPPLVDAARLEGYLVVELERPRPTHRGRLALFIEEAIETELSELGASPPGVGASVNLDASLSDQLYRARLAHKTGLLLAFAPLDGIANRAGALDAEDSAVLRWWMRTTEERPVRLHFDARDRYLGVYAAPTTLGALVFPEPTPDVAVEVTKPSPPSSALAQSVSPSPDATSNEPTAETAASSDEQPALATSDSEASSAEPLDEPEAVSPSDEPSSDFKDEPAPEPVDSEPLVAETAMAASELAVADEVLDEAPEPVELAAEEAPEAIELTTTATPASVIELTHTSAPPAVLTVPETSVAKVAAGAVTSHTSPSSASGSSLAQAMARVLSDVDEELAGSEEYLRSSPLEFEPEPSLLRGLPPEDETPVVSKNVLASLLSMETQPADVVPAAVTRPEPLVEAPLASSSTTEDDRAPVAPQQGDRVRPRAPLLRPRVAPTLVSAQAPAPALDGLASSAPQPSAEPRETRPVRAPARPVKLPSIEERNAWIRELEAARGPKPLAAIERLFVSAYLPLTDALARGVDDPRASAATSAWAKSFDKSYRDAFDALRLRGKRPTMVLDVPDLALRIGRLHGARSTQLVLVDGMRFDLGLRVQDRLQQLLGQQAALSERVLLWSGLPTTTALQLELIGRGPAGLRELPMNPESEPSVARGRGASTLRRVKAGNRELFKLDLVEARLSEHGPAVGERLDTLADEVAECLAAHFVRVPPRTLVMMFGDHGFVLDPQEGGSSPARQGGASPEEVLVPAFAWIVGPVH